MVIMFAEVKQDGEWHKVGKEFVSTFPELKDQLTDRVCDSMSTDLPNFLCMNTNVWYVPEDTSIEIYDYIIGRGDYPEDWCCATLRDILHFPWNSMSFKNGYITEWQYKRMKEQNIMPASVINDSINKDAEFVKPSYMDLILKYPALRTSNKYYVEFEYGKQSYKDKFDFFYNVSLAKLVQLIPDGGTVNDVRIIYTY